MINSEKLQWIYSDKVDIFTIENFLTKESFENIEKNFPEFKSINKNNFYKFENNKFAITSGTKEYQDIILENEVLKNFDLFVNSEKFKKVFFYNLYKKIIFSRGFDLKHFIKLLKIPKFVSKIENSFFEKNISLFSKLRITIQYSYILNNGKIVPHADAGDKLLTLLLFFPKYNQNQDFFEREKNYGTTFWKSNHENINNSHLNDKIKQKKFFKNSEVLFKANFLKNYCVGFIKNKYSWHSVEPINVNEDYIRKSININIYY